MHPQVMRAGQEPDLFLGHLKTILLETKTNHLTQTEGKYLGILAYLVYFFVKKVSFFTGDLPEHELGWQHTEANVALLSLT